mgnify:CR=1 FL=1
MKKEYGYLKNGILFTKELTEEERKDFPDYLPVDDIDHTRTVTDDGYIIELQPYVNGGRISYNYIRKVDKQAIRAEIRKLKDSLAESDYKVTKCYEASLTVEKPPYDISALHIERQSKRDRINELELQL